MFRLILAVTCAFALCVNVFADIDHWVSEPYQPAVIPGSDPVHPDFNDGSYWTVDLMVRISGNDDWFASEVDASLFGGDFFYHELGDRTPPLAAHVNIYPALQYDTMLLSTEADANNQPPRADPYFVPDADFDPQHIWVCWFDSGANGGDGDFVIARFTVKLTAEGAVLILDGYSCIESSGPELHPFYFDVWVGGPPADCNNNGIWDYLDMMNCDGSPWCSDCNNNGIIDECDILDGTSEDCNSNGIPDECDIADGTSDDYDLNGVPDECEDCNGNGVPDGCDIDCATGNCADHPLGCGGSEDCNENGMPDECDIAEGTSEDCQPNGIPDECDIADGTSEDVNENGIPDECECLGDITGDAATDQADLGILLALWGNCEGDGDYDPAADLDGDGCIGHGDLGILLADWGCDFSD